MPASLWRAATQVVLKSNYWYVAITSKAIVKYFFRKIEVSYLFWLFLQNIRIYNINALQNIHCAFYPQTHDLWIEYLLEKKYLIWSLDTFEKSHTVQTLSTLTFCGRPIYYGMKIILSSCGCHLYWACELLIKILSYLQDYVILQHRQPADY